MSRIIVVANQKGGVGKTTTVANLGVALAQAGQRVVLVDIDPQASLTVSFGMDAYTVKPSVYNLILDKQLPLRQILTQVRPGLDLAPSNAALIAADFKLLNMPDRLSRLEQSLGSCCDWFDYMLIDTPPNLGLLTLNALVVGHELLIPVSTDYLAMRGVRAMLETIWLIRKRISSETVLLGLLPTLYDPQSKNADTIVAEMRRVFRHKVFRTVVPRDEWAAVAPAARQAVLDYRPDSEVSRSYQKLAEEVLNGHR